MQRRADEMRHWGRDGRRGRPDQTDIQTEQDMNRSRYRFTEASADAGPQAGKTAGDEAGAHSHSEKCT